MPEEPPAPKIRVNTSYVVGQLARALATSRDHVDGEVRARALRKVDEWVNVFTGMLKGILEVGSRVPVSGAPAWATLKVVTGGFATGELLADGALQEHERELLARIGASDAEDVGNESAARARINAYYVSDVGLRELTDALESGRYRVSVPEEGALLVVAWLLAHGGPDGAESARLLDEIGPYFSRLRFYPVPNPRPLASSHLVRVQDVRDSVAQLAAVRGRAVALRQREAANVWAPLHDRVIDLLLETVEGEPPRVRLTADGTPVRRPSGSYDVEGGWPCQRYPGDWAPRVQTLLADYERLRAQHSLCRTSVRRSRSLGQLLYVLRTSSEAPQSLTGRDVTHVRTMLAGFLHKRGAPDSARHRRLRADQQRQTARPTTRELADVLADRLRPCPENGGLELVDSVLAPTTQAETTQEVPPGSEFPMTLRLKVLRAWDATPEALVELRVITSGEALARVIPQLTAQVRAASIPDPALARLYTALYTSFRRRRSLLLLDLQSQVKLREIPWVKPLDSYRADTERERERARQLLTQLVMLTVRAFPQAIIPNKLLQEIVALAETSGLTLPLVEEVAADIFMGDFSEKFLRAAQGAAKLLDGLLYARYYDIPCGRLRLIEDVTKRRYGAPISPAFAELCRERAARFAHVHPDSRRSGSFVAVNGTIVEQSQILTTHNLAVLFESLGLADELRPALVGLARRSFTWLCRRLQFRSDEKWHAKLLAVKNAAYAWRQMVFYLSFVPQEVQEAFVGWAQAELIKRPGRFSSRFAPALRGLHAAVRSDDGSRLADPAEPGHGGDASRLFLGWATGTHWLLAE